MQAKIVQEFSILNMRALDKDLEKNKYKITEILDYTL